MLTVKQLADLAGVTPRTLHYYDEIDLLKPSRVGDNGYRYYAQEALLRLQQILLYRQLGMPLKQIRTLVNRPDFDVAATLRHHKKELRQRIAQMERLVATVDDTLLHIKGKMKMDDKQLFEPFSEAQQAEYEQEALRRYDPETVKASIKRWNTYSKAEKQRIQEEGNAVYHDLLRAIPQGPGSAAAQAAVARWHRHMNYFWEPNDRQLIGLAEGYLHDSRFRVAFDKIDPALAPFLRQAVAIYVDARA